MSKKLEKHADKGFSPERTKKGASDINLADIVRPSVSDEELLFLKQLGLNYVEAWMSGKQTSFSNLLSFRRRTEAAGLKIFTIGNYDVCNSDKIQLALPGRDEKIEEFQTFLRNMGKAGIHATTYFWEPNGHWSTGREKTRGCISRAFDLEEAKKRPLTHGRVYKDEELWATYTYFIKAVIPVAEEAGVRLALHPADPPVPSLGGIARIFRNFESFKRAMEIANSDYSGLCFCVGSWAEGGLDIEKAIRYFGKRCKIFSVHFRNVSAPVPHFVETFVDDGYVDMYQVMKVLKETGFKGTLSPDHIPGFVNSSAGYGVGTAYSIAYMRGLLQALDSEADSG